MTKKKKILFIVNQAKYFISHRLVIAREAQKKGYDVHVAVPFKDEFETLKKEDMKLHNIHISRTGLNLFGEILSILSIWKIIFLTKPNVVHLISIKSVIYGGVIARFHNLPSVMAISGLGYLSSSGKDSFTKNIAEVLLRISLNHDKSIVIVQNDSDKRALQGISALRRDQTTLIPGSGVNVNEYRSTPLPNDTPIVLMPSRMLWDKGVGIFVRAAEIIKSKNASIRFVLAGPYDPGNPSSVPIKQLKKWNNGDIVEWWGDRKDMPSVYQQSHLVVFPSHYGEGVPKVLLEALSSGRPIITTNTAGCNDTIDHEINGLLVRPKDPESLASSITNLLNNHSSMIKMSNNNRKKAEKLYDEKFVISKHLSIYYELLDKYGKK